MKYDYDMFLKQLDLLIDKFGEFKPDIILAIARGGLCPALFISQKLGIRELYTLNSIHYDDKKKLDHIKIYNIPDLDENNNILIVDDIIDSGDTMEEILKRLTKLYPNNRYKIATLFYKKSATIKPDFSLNEANEWIDFFWDVK